MNLDAFARFLPPQDRSGVQRAIARRAATLAALVVLAVVTCAAYFWYAGDVARRQALSASQQPGGLVVPPPVEVDARAQQPVTAPGYAPPAVANPDSIDRTPGQRRALCAYLAAEQERLNHEFRQPLPPPVIDRIASEIAYLGGQASRYGCTPDKGQRDTG